MQTATSETEIKSLYLSICVHHYTLRAPCPKGQGIWNTFATVGVRDFLENGCSLSATPWRGAMPWADTVGPLPC